MKFLKLLFKQLGIFIAWVSAATVYIWLFIKLCVYTFGHWWVHHNVYWYCNNTITRYTTHCKSVWHSDNFHWGLFFFIVIWIIFSVIIGLIIDEAVRESRN